MLMLCLGNNTRHVLFKVSTSLRDVIVTLMCQDKKWKYRFPERA